LVGVGWWVVVGVECGAWSVHCPWWIAGACLVAVGGTWLWCGDGWSSVRPRWEAWGHKGWGYRGAGGGDRRVIGMGA